MTDDEIVAGFKSYMDKRSEQRCLAEKVIEEARRSGYRFPSGHLYKADINKAMQWLNTQEQR